MFKQDIGLWPSTITDQFKEYFTESSPNQNMDRISNSGRLYGKVLRKMTCDNFYFYKKNENKIKREWLIYSPSKKSVFCYICILYNTSHTDIQLCKNGLNDWQNISNRLLLHEKSFGHRQAVCTFSNRSSILRRIDSDLIVQQKQETAYWRSILERVVSTVKFLSVRSLPFFGSDEKLNSSHNGNFLGIMELISQYDPFLSQHLKQYGNLGSGHVNYISSFTVREFIDIMANKVLNNIIENVKQVEYFGLIVDSTPDITHTDQLSVVLRYVNDTGEPIERFMTFHSIDGHTAEYLSSSIVDLFKNWNLNIKKCVGQSFDNASNMAGKYTGVQARIKNISPMADFVPCAAHSLNLVGVNSIESCTQAVNYFGLVQAIYVFFSSSTKRWKLLTDNLKKTKNTYILKPHSETRWSSNANAVQALQNGYNIILSVLNNIYENENEKPQYRVESNNLLKQLKKKETAVFTCIWNSILSRINESSIQLQSTTRNFSNIIPIYNSLIIYIQSVRDNFNLYEEKSSCFNVATDYTLLRKKKLLKVNVLMLQTQLK